MCGMRALERGYEWGLVFSVICPHFLSLMRMRIRLYVVEKSC